MVDGMLTSDNGWWPAYQGLPGNLKEAQGARGWRCHMIDEKKIVHEKWEKAPSQYTKENKINCKNNTIQNAK